MSSEFEFVVDSDSSREIGKEGGTNGQRTLARAEEASNFSLQEKLEIEQGMINFLKARVQNAVQAEEIRGKSLSLLSENLPKMDPRTQVSAFELLTAVSQREHELLYGMAGQSGKGNVLGIAICDRVSSGHREMQDPVDSNGNGVGYRDEGKLLRSLARICECIQNGPRDEISQEAAPPSLEGQKDGYHFIS